MKNLDAEKKTLAQTLKLIKEVLTTEREDLDDILTGFMGSKEDLWRIVDMKKIHIANLETSLDQPYFARIDFTSEEDGKLSTIYIGKNGVMRDSSIIVTDWRAPISSLYYEADVGRCSYESPSGIISGNMSLKRQYEIEHGQLLDYFDVDLVSNDNLLQKYLNSNNDARLKSIVSTIQREQNEVIRKKLSDNLIIQGVAGSGKTTVALHRIAYLVYNYLNSIQQNQYLVIGPNPVFLKYIKSVLPELDVSGVEQCTFEQFASQYIHEDIHILPSDKKVNDSIAGKRKNDIDSFKCSMRFKTMLDHFLEVFFHSLTIQDLKLGDFVVVESSIIKAQFEATKTTYNSSLSNRVEMTISSLCNYIESNLEQILSRYSDYTYQLFAQAKEEDKITLRTKFAKEHEELGKNCRSILRKYFSRAKESPTKLYKIFINSLRDFDIYNYEHIHELQKQTLSNIQKRNYEFEDLSALIYIKQAILPDKDYSRIRHVVVDEAQDLGEFNFHVLKVVLPNATFSIFGDLAQSIYDYRGVHDWQSVNEAMFENQGQIINFNKSYRNTAEIMSVADDVASSIGLNKSELVVRHGEPVRIVGADEAQDIPDLIARKILEYKDKGYKTIAIISKTDLLSRYLNDDLLERGIRIPNVSMDDDLSDEKFAICTISNQLAKGLEFDAVIINNACETIYSSTNDLDMKLLYVALTRALHSLDIIYSGDLTKPLLKHLKKSDDVSKTI